MSFADNETIPASCTWVFPLLGIMPYETQAVNHSKEDVSVKNKFMKKFQGSIRYPTKGTLLNGPTLVKMR